MLGQFTLKLQLQIGGKLLIAIHLNQSIWLSNQNSQIVFITFFSGIFYSFRHFLTPSNFEEREG